jgi:hypothetical protein
MAVIGRELRDIYASIIAEGVPERFAEILRKLDDPSNEEEATASPGGAAPDVKIQDEAEGTIAESRSLVSTPIACCLNLAPLLRGVFFVCSVSSSHGLSNSIFLERLAVLSGPAVR